MSGSVVVVYAHDDEFKEWQDANPDLAPLVRGVSLMQASHLDGLRVLDFIILTGARRFPGIQVVREHLERSKRMMQPEGRLRALLDLKTEYERARASRPTRYVRID